MVLEEWQPEAPACTSSHSPMKSHAPLQLAQRAVGGAEVTVGVVDSQGHSRRWLPSTGRWLQLAWCGLPRP